MSRRARELPPLTPAQRDAAGSLAPKARQYAAYTAKHCPRLDPDDIESDFGMMTCRAVSTLEPAKGASLNTHFFNCCKTQTRSLLRSHRLRDGRHGPLNDALDEAEPIKPSNWEEEEAVHKALKHLPEKWRTVIIERFWNDRGLREIAVDLGVTKENIRQIEGKAIARLRGAMSKHA